MNTFNVYPKRGEMFSLECSHFEFDENSFTLYDEGRSISKEGFLSFDNVAAILPADTPNPERAELIFKVYLKNRPQPLEVTAYSFKTDQPPSVQFFRRVYYGDNPEVLIDYVYVALSEVVAIIPSDGLKHRWR